MTHELKTVTLMSAQVMAHEIGARMDGLLAQIEATGQLPAEPGAEPQGPSVRRLASAYLAAAKAHTDLRMALTLSEPAQELAKVAAAIAANCQVQGLCSAVLAPAGTPSPERTELQETYAELQAELTRENKDLAIRIHALRNQPLQLRLPTVAFSDALLG